MGVGTQPDMGVGRAQPDVGVGLIKAGAESVTVSSPLRTPSVSRVEPAGWARQAPSQRFRLFQTKNTSVFCPLFVTTDDAS